VSSRYYGSSIELLSRYAWYIRTSQDRTWPVGQKRPNDLGLFDMMGNLYTWVADINYWTPNGLVLPKEEEDSKPVEDRVPRVIRGGCYNGRPSFVRSAARGDFEPGGRDDNIGVRVVRTCD
jgi:formylglycine-generating enzyme required for sulfatase activity